MVFNVLNNRIQIIQETKTKNNIYNLNETPLNKWLNVRIVVVNKTLVINVTDDNKVYVNTVSYNNDILVYNTCKLYMSNQINMMENVEIKNFKFQNILKLKKDKIPVELNNLHSKSNLHKKIKLSWNDLNDRSLFKKITIREKNNKYKLLEIYDYITEYTIYDLLKNTEYNFIITYCNIYDIESNPVEFPMGKTNKYNLVENAYGVLRKDNTIYLYWDKYDNVNNDLLKYNLYIKTTLKTTKIQINLTTLFYVLKKINIGEKYEFFISVYNVLTMEESELYKFNFNVVLLNIKDIFKFVNKNTILNKYPIILKKNFKLSFNFVINDIHPQDSNIFSIINKKDSVKKTPSEKGDMICSLNLYKNSTKMYIQNEIISDIFYSMNNYNLDIDFKLHKIYNIDISLIENGMFDELKVKLFINKNNELIFIKEFKTNILKSDNFKFSDTYIYVSHPHLNNSFVKLCCFNLQNIKKLDILKINNFDIVNVERNDSWNRNNLLNFNGFIDVYNEQPKTTKITERLKITVNSLNNAFKDCLIFW